MITRMQWLTAVLFAAVSAQASAVGAKPADHSQPIVISPERYGAVGDGMADDTAAIRRAESALEQAGGGTLQFGKGKTYLLATVSKYAVRVPVGAPHFQTADESHQYHVL